VFRHTNLQKLWHNITPKAIIRCVLSKPSTAGRKFEFGGWTYDDFNMNNSPTSCYIQISLQQVMLKTVKFILCVTICLYYRPHNTYNTVLHKASIRTLTTSTVSGKKQWQRNNTFLHVRMTNDFLNIKIQIWKNNYSKVCIIFITAHHNVTETHCWNKPSFLRLTTNALPYHITSSNLPVPNSNISDVGSQRLHSSL